MGFDYLKGLYWRDVTRDERYFCAELFFEIKKDVPAFVKWLQQNKVVDINANELQAQWEIGYEVCFYRDYIIKYGDENGNTSIKKTSTARSGLLIYVCSLKNTLLLLKLKLSRVLRVNRTRSLEKTLKK